jgi:hypothetical protein
MKLHANERQSWWRVAIFAARLVYRPRLRSMMIFAVHVFGVAENLYVGRSIQPER